MNRSFLSWWVLGSGSNVSLQAMMKECVGVIWEVAYPLGHSWSLAFLKLFCKVTNYIQTFKLHRGLFRISEREERGGFPDYGFQLLHYGQRITQLLLTFLRDYLGLLKQDSTKKI